MADDGGLFERLREAYFTWQPLSQALEASIRRACRQGQADEFQRAFASSIRTGSFPVHATSGGRFLRRLILVLEECGVEVEEELYSSEAAVSQGDNSLPCYRTYFLGGAKEVSISLAESSDLASGGTTGLRTWTAAKCLSRVLRSDPFLVRDKKRIVELGAGVGFLGISLLAAGALGDDAHYVFTDAHVKVQESLENNCKDNRLEQQAYEVRKLDWRSFSAEDVDALAPDFVLASDVVFDPGLLPDLCRVISILLKRPGCSGIVACAVRNPDTLAAFEAALKENDLSFKCSEWPEGEEEVKLYTIKREG